MCKTQKLFSFSVNNSLFLLNSLLASMCFNFSCFSRAVKNYLLMKIMKITVLLIFLPLILLAFHEDVVPSLSKTEHIFYG